MFGEEVRAVGHGLLVYGGAQHLGEAGRLVKGVARRHLVPAHDDRALGAEEPRGEPGEGLVARPSGRVHAGRGTEVDGRRLVEDVAGEGDEHRPRRRGERNLGRPPHDAGQVLEPVHLDRPLDERLRDGDEGVVEEGLGEAVPDLLLPRRHQHRRPPELRVVQRPHRVPEPGRDVHVAGREPAARPRVAIRHRDHDPLLEAEHVPHVRLAAQGVHDGKLGGARVAEQAIDPFVTQQRQEGGSPRDEVPARSGGVSSSGLHSSPPGMVRRLGAPWDWRDRRCRWQPAERARCRVPPVREVHYCNRLGRTTAHLRQPKQGAENRLAGTRCRPPGQAGARTFQSMP